MIRHRQSKATYLAESLESVIFALISCRDLEGAKSLVFLMNLTSFEFHL